MLALVVKVFGAIVKQLTLLVKVIGMVVLQLTLVVTQLAMLFEVVATSVEVFALVGWVL